MKIGNEKSLINHSVEEYRRELTENLDDALVSNLRTLSNTLLQDTASEAMREAAIVGLKSLTRNVGTIGIHLMDYYLIARMLCTHDGSVEAHKKCIVYVGEDHEKTYKKILREMGFNLVYESTSGTAQSACLDISNMVWPHFLT
jgi:hypothetical protein